MLNIRNFIPEGVKNTSSNQYEIKENLINRIKEIYKKYGYEKYISVDLGLVNHIHYYTGILFKGYVSNYSKAVISRGRYDNLTKHYGNYMPATGFGLNIDELMEGYEDE